ncbi:hypothetical protein HYH03_002548 [Edaphochlamys debaryana]|uniref:K Homology domain-containing protein n=1 Tax=Edaphochlamys debaryana TaxID=47281 RepID=A0A835YB03_9CHLO|nr:hypothetical protein HYH03_002548 [Edaphochlamys debaryana]KAG2499608.1 hypothetical protein HYH03_002548 [Edaphochlamys debaryana]|eukprot:KAG2499607.1 hypothetical protein HYH03_002548 [Edaphochlamys debaryana]
MVGRVIGKNGETVKALQTYTGATIQIDQSVDPTRVSISGAAYSVNLAVSIVTDIIRGSFKGFALLRQATRPANGRNGYPAFTEPRPVYAPGYGLIPASQLYDDRTAPPPMGTPYGLRPADASLQHVYPLMTSLPTQSGPTLLALQQDAALAQQGTMSLVNAQLQQLGMPTGDLGGLTGGGMQYGEATYIPVMGVAGGGHGGPGAQALQMGTSEDYAMSASHRLIQAAGGGRGGMRPKAWLG